MIVQLLLVALGSASGVTVPPVLKAEAGGRFEVSYPPSRPLLFCLGHSAASLVR